MPSSRRLKLSSELIVLLRSTHPSIKAKIRGGLDALLENPALGKSLREELAGLRSLKVGRFRIIYRLQGSTLEIVAVGPRPTIYQETSRRLKDTTFPPRRR